MIGKCFLCLSDNVALRNSHVFPAWQYKRAREPGLPTGDPVFIVDGEARIRSKQVRQHLLCGPCEDKFSGWEDYVARLTDPNVTPPVLTSLCSGRVQHSSQLWEASAPGLDCEAVFRFGASILWRCHVSTEIKEYSLGSRYAELIRATLDQGADIPRQINLILVYFEDALTTDPRLAATFGFPRVRRERSFRWHYLNVPGLLFMFAIGNVVPPDIAERCLAKGPSGSIFIGPQEHLTRWLRNCAEGAKPFGKLAR